MQWKEFMQWRQWYENRENPPIISNYAGKAGMKMCKK